MTCNIQQFYLFIEVSEKEKQKNTTMSEQLLKSNRNVVERCKIDTNRNYSAILATLQITSYVHSRNSS
jgi:hypothetical protein